MAINLLRDEYLVRSWYSVKAGAAAFDCLYPYTRVRFIIIGLYKNSILRAEQALDDLYSIAEIARTDAMQDYSDQLIEAQVSRIGWQAGAEIGDAVTFPVVLKLSQTDLMIQPGMIGRVEIYCWE